MFRFVRYKIRSKKWLNFCLFIGVAMMAGFMAMYPMFLKGSNEKTLQSVYEEYGKTRNEFPCTIGREGVVYRNGYKTFADVVAEIKEYEKDWEDTLRIPVVQRQETILAFIVNGQTTLRELTKYYNVATVVDFEEHMELLSGRFSQANGECVVSKTTLDFSQLSIGERITMRPDPEKDAMVLTIVGVVGEREDQPVYWHDRMEDQFNYLYVSYECLEELVNEYYPETVRYSSNLMLDYRALSAQKAEVFAHNVNWYEKNDSSLHQNMSATMALYFEKQRTVGIVMLTFELPIVALMLLFLYMISGQILQMETTEIAMLKSRGIKKRQVLGLYLLQSFLISLAGCAVGLGIGYGLCKLGASADSFLGFGSLSTYGYDFTWSMLPFLGIALVLAVIFMTLPVRKLAGFTIKDAAKKAGKHTEKPVWEKFFLDLAGLLLASYLLYNYGKQKDDLAMLLLEGGQVDPVLFLSSSLFLLSAGLFFLRLIGYFIRGLYRLFRKRLKPAGYVAFLQMIRGKKKQGFILVFLVMTVGMGVFHANLARSVNENTAERIRYDTGADVVTRADWKLTIQRDENQNLHWYYSEPDFEDLGTCAKVIRDENIKIAIKGHTELQHVLLGINTKEFGETASLRDGVNDTHWYNALNALAMSPDGVLISQNLADKYNVQIGDAISYARFSPVDNLQPMPLSTYHVVGIVKAFPGYNMAKYRVDQFGRLRKTERYLVVANFATVQSAFGIMPYENWKCLEAGETAEAYLEQISQKHSFKSVQVTDELIRKEQSEAMLQITNGIFSVGFVLSLLVCGSGFLVYWILTIRERELMYGIYRAMGMTMREVLRMLFLEQIFNSVLAVAAGFAVGTITSYLFIPVISIVYLPKDHNLPIAICADFGDVLKIAGMVGIVFVVCFVILGRIIRKLNITQALKLGDD